MIRIHKPASAPQILQGRGQTQTQTDCAGFDNDPGYRSGRKRFKFKRAIYANKKVKSVLLKAQHDKCAFCERRITPSSYGDVEHYRPKGAFRASTTGRKQTPAYYWLAYAWDNLLASCEICNQRFKGEAFPLLNESRRARSHHDDVSAEQPALINPATEDPSQFITFRGEIPCSIGGGRRGKETIRLLGLDRPKLNDDRMEKLEVLLYLRKVVDMAEANPKNQVLQSLLREARSFLASAVQDTSEYAAMARAALAIR